MKNKYAAIAILIIPIGFLAGVLLVNFASTRIIISLAFAIIGTLIVIYFERKHKRRKKGNVVDMYEGREWFK